MFRTGAPFANIPANMQMKYMQIMQIYDELSGDMRRLYSDFSCDASGNRVAVLSGPRVRIPPTPPRNAVVHDTMGYRIFLFFCRRSSYIKRFSEYGGAKVLNARISLFYRRCTADFCFAPPYGKNQKVDSFIKRL